MFYKMFLTALYLLSTVFSEENNNESKSIDIQTQSNCLDKTSFTDVDCNLDDNWTSEACCVELQLQKEQLKNREQEQKEMKWAGITVLGTGAMTAIIIGIFIVLAIMGYFCYQARKQYVVGVHDDEAL